MQLYGVGKKLDEVPSCNGIAPLKKECEVIIENWKKVSKNWFNNLNKYGDPLGQTKIMPSPPPISPSTSPLPQ